VDTIEVDVEVDPVNGTSDETDLAENSDDFFAFIYPYFLNRDPSSFGAWLVFMEMSLALIGIILNLTVLVSTLYSHCSKKIGRFKNKNVSILK
jgi:hypothetical protein